VDFVQPVVEVQVLLLKAQFIKNMHGMEHEKNGNKCVKKKCS
jgi:hypothetical protein